MIYLGIIVAATIAAFGILWRMERAMERALESHDDERRA